MNILTELSSMIAKIPHLESLPYENTEFADWENGVLELLRNDSHYSEYYKELLHQAQYAYWRPGKGDPRGSASTPKLYQYEYRHQIEKYRAILEQVYLTEKQSIEESEQGWPS
jgi:hypothetical protein